MIHILFSKLLSVPPDEQLNILVIFVSSLIFILNSLLLIRTNVFSFLCIHFLIQFAVSWRNIYSVPIWETFRALYTLYTLGAVALLMVVHVVCLYLSLTSRSFSYKAIHISPILVHVCYRNGTSYEPEGSVNVAVTLNGVLQLPHKAHGYKFYMPNDTAGERTR